ncbi:MAG: hypothetical protein ACRCT1_17580 [Microcoleaceae cyanobacterium]|jgi:hypothetical protein
MSVAHNFQKTDAIAIDRGIPGESRNFNRGEALTLFPESYKLTFTRVVSFAKSVFTGVSPKLFLLTYNHY